VSKQDNKPEVKQGKNPEQSGNKENIEQSAEADITHKPPAKTKDTQKTKSNKSKANTGSHHDKQKYPWLVRIASVFALTAFVVSIINLIAIRSGDSDQLVLQNDNQNLEVQVQDLNKQLMTLRQQNNQLQEIAQSNQQGQSDLSDSLENISKTLKRKGKRPIRWKLAEVEYLLSVANHQLLLEQDVNTSLSALSDADNQLEVIGDPALIPIRKKIAAEKIALNSVQLPDIIGISLQLTNLVASISQLPLISNKRAFVAEAKNEKTHQVENWQEIPQAIWKDIKGLVTVRRSSAPIEPLLPPDERHYLTQNLGLKLEQSRLALLRRDNELYRRNLKDTRIWVDQYFDKEDAAVNMVINSVDEMLGVELQPGLPDISGSLRALRRWLQDDEQNQTTKAARPQSPLNKVSLTVNADTTARKKNQ
jgi:uroporphyrin-3 C-methyltransferase